MGDKQKKGFSGLSDLGVDIDDILNDHQAKKGTAKPKVVNEQPEDNETQSVNNSNPSSSTTNEEEKGSSISSWFWGFVITGFILWLLVQYTNQSNDVPRPPKDTSSKTTTSSNNNYPDTYSKPKKEDNREGGTTLNTNSQSKTSNYSNSNDYSNTFSISKKDNYYESKPAPYTKVLSKNEVLYCEAEMIRLDVANKIIDPYSQYEVSKYNNLSNDYNSRCSNKQYYKNDMYYVKSQIEKRKSQIQQEGLARFQKKETKKTALSTYSLTVKPTPSGARVMILNIKPKYHDGIRLKKGSYHIKVSKKGYHTMKEWIKLEKNEYFTVELQKDHISSSSKTSHDTVAPKYRHNSKSKKSPSGLPKNAELNVYGNDWKCKYGYRKYSGKCIPVGVGQ